MEEGRGARQTVVISHGPCPDGWTAAWCYWRTLSIEVREKLAAYGGHYTKLELQDSIQTEEGAPPATSQQKAMQILQEGSPVAFIFATPGDIISLDLVRDRNVIIMDLVLERSIESILDVAHSVLLLDHHKSAQAFVEERKDKWDTKKISITFDMGRSAAAIAWQHFHPEQPVPPIVAYVQDKDLWTWKLPNSEAISEVIYTFKYVNSFWLLEDTHQKWASDPKALEEVALLGRAALEYQKRLLEDMSTKAVKTTAEAIVDGEKRSFNVLLINTPILNSELGNHLMVAVAPRLANLKSGWVADFSAMWNYRFEEDIMTVSLRTNRNDVDLSVIAKTIVGDGVRPGGGHAKAAAFTLHGCNIKSVFKPIPK